MRRSSAAALFAIFIVAIFIRLLPLTGSVYWGADVGEYHKIASQMVNDGYVSTEYVGWGAVYPYFPGFYFVVGGPSMLGLDVGAMLSLVPPILNAISVLVIFFIAARIFHDDRVGLIAAGVIAVAMPFVYPDSHPIPGSIGMLFVLASFAVLVSSIPSGKKKLALLIPITIALILTHHMSTYFLIIAILMAAVLKSLLSRRYSFKDIGVEIGYMAVVLALVLPFWLLYATPFRDSILSDLDMFPWWAPFVILGLLLAMWPIIVRLRQRSSWRYVPKFPSLRRSSSLVVVALVFVFGLTIAFTVTSVLGTNIRISFTTVLFMSPFLLLVTFSVAGRRVLDFARYGFEPSGWFIAFALSTIVGSFVGAQVLVPYRHIDFLMVPIAVMIGAGLVLLNDLAFKGRKGSRVVVILVGLLIASNIPLAYPPPEIMAGYEEGVKPQSLVAVSWLPSYVDGLLAADHKSSMIAFGFGDTNATWDTARDSLLAVDFESARAEMLNVSSPSGRKRVDFVMLSIESRRGTQLLPWEPAYQLSEEAQGKFEELPYQRLYDDGYSQVYMVNWGLT